MAGATPGRALRFGSMPDRSKLLRATEDPALEAAAREIAQRAAVRDFGEAGFCVQVIRIKDREFRCYIAHQPGKPGDLVGKTITVMVPE